MEIFVVCNTGYEECQFICAFTEFDAASQYISKKWGDYDNIVVFKHVLNSKELGEEVVSIKTAQIRNCRY
jgi:hypothetical protein